MLIIKISEKLLKDGKVSYYFLIDKKETREDSIQIGKRLDNG